MYLQLVSLAVEIWRRLGKVHMITIFISGKFGVRELQLINRIPRVSIRVHSFRLWSIRLIARCLPFFLAMLLTRGPLVQPRCLFLQSVKRHVSHFCRQPFRGQSSTLLWLWHLWHWTRPRRVLSIKNARLTFHPRSPMRSSDRILPPSLLHHLPIKENAFISPRKCQKHLLHSQAQPLLVTFVDEGPWWFLLNVRCHILLTIQHTIFVHLWGFLHLHIQATVIT